MLDPQIALAGTRVTPTDPNEEAIKAGQASDALALARQRIQSRQDDAAFATAMQQAGGDPDKAITLLQTTNPRAALTYGSMITKQRQDNLKLSADQVDLEAKRTKSAYSLFQGLEDNPDPKQYQIAIDGAAAMLGDTPAGRSIAQLPRDATPDQIPGIARTVVEKGMEAKAYHDEIAAGFKAWLGGDPVAGLAHMLEVTDDPQMRQSIIQSAKAHGAPDAFVMAATSLSNQVTAGADPKTFRQLLGPQKPIEVPANGTLIDPVTQKPIFTAPPPAATPYQVESLAERTRHDKVMEAKPTAAQAAANQPTPVIEPGTPDFKVAQDLAYGRMTPSFFRTLQAYNRDAGKKAALYAKAAELNPNFNEADFERGFKFISSPRIASQLASLDNVQSGVSDLLKASDAATRSGSPLLNKAIIPAAGLVFGNKKYSNWETARTAFADELSGALGYGSATDMSREMGFNMTDKNLSPDAFRSGIQDIVMPFVERKRASLLKQGSVYGQSSNNSAVKAPLTYDPKTGKWSGGGGD